MNRTSSCGSIFHEMSDGLTEKEQSDPFITAEVGVRRKGGVAKVADLMTRCCSRIAPN